MSETAESILLAPTSTRELPALGVVRRIVRETGLALITAGVVILLFVAYQLFGTALTEQRDQSRLQKSFNVALTHSRAAASGDSPVVGGTLAGDLSPSTPSGTAIDHLVIPKIHVDKFVVQGTAEADLMQGPGHYINTPFPGEKGNAAIAGHRTTYGAPFFELNKLKQGNLIYLTNTRGRTFDYKVFKLEVVSPSDVSVLDNTPDAQLTLTTCNPPYSATSRLIIVAHLVGRPIPTPKVIGTADLGPGALSLGTGNSGAWPPALAYGGAAIVLWIGTRLLVNRSRRWRRAAALAGGIAVCALPLWFCFENVVQLLPQSI